MLRLRLPRNVAVAAYLDFGQRGADGDRLPGIGQNLQQATTGRCGNLRINLVGRDFDQRFAFTHRVARLF